MDTPRRVALIRNRKGLALIYIAIAMLVLCGALGLAVDVGHMQVVRGELQNAADAVALAGAASLYQNPANPGDSYTLDWNGAKTAATNFINKNKSDGIPLADASITVGYWNTANKIMQPTTITPVIGQDIPAVMATISRSAGSNNGPVSTFFMQVLGKDSAPVGSRASVAMSGYPGAVPPAILFPMAISKCMTDQYLSQNPLPQPPTTIRITSAYGAGGPGCQTGQWTSFKLDRNDVPTIRDLVTDGNPTPLQVGDDIWIQPGAEASLFTFVDKWLPAGGIDVVVAIVDSGGGDFSKGELPITGFATFHIDRSVGGSGKYVEGHFVNFNPVSIPGTTPGGSLSNSITPPQLAF